MTQFAWYSPELNVIILLTFMEGCSAIFEWDQQDLYEQLITFGPGGSPAQEALWFPLGAL